MYKAFVIGLLLIYYLYFYHSFSTTVSKPTSGAPSRPQVYNTSFLSKNPNHFQFNVNQKTVWEHTLATDSYTFHKGKIIQRDACHGTNDGDLIVATGRALYDHLMANPNLQNKLSFNRNTSLTQQQGNVFYFTCQNNRIHKVNICPSGTIFQHGKCEDINLCTEKPDGTKFSHPVVTKFIQCENEKEIVKDCPDEHFFRYDRCISMKDVNNYCQFYTKSFLLDERTKVDCRNGEPVYTRCSKGTRFFENDYCEPENCVGLPDDTKLPLPQRTIKPFQFIPGYMRCQKNKVAETVECPKEWDEYSSKGDNLTLLPMVFDGKDCSVPTFCENVSSEDPDVIVPVHEFTKYVKNWNLSENYDTSAGYICDHGVRRKRVLAPGMRINKRFKPEPACGESVAHIPIYDRPKHYYDCASKNIIECPKNQFFNGTRCLWEPKHSFNYNKIPLFGFDSLNQEGWIEAWNYSGEKQISCKDPESVYLELYNICSDPECVNYEFLSQIPQFEMLLPTKFKCKFYKNEKLLKKEPVKYEHNFWNQKLLKEAPSEEEECTPGQNIQTGNFIWDNTIFATCDMNQPFIFCPSVHSKSIIPIGNSYACADPKSDTFPFMSADWTLFQTNELKRIKPYKWDDKHQYFRLNKSGGVTLLPKSGFDIPENIRLNLHVSQPVNLEVRYRVTHPPNIAYQYDDNHERIPRLSAKGTGFLVKKNDFTHKPLTFPQYKVSSHVDSFREDYHFD